MTAGLDFFDEGALPAPRVPIAEALELARTRFGLEVEASPLGSQQDQNFLLSNAGGPVGVLKLSNRAIGLTEIVAQDLASDLIAERCPELRVATTLTGADGGKLLDVLDTSSGPLVARVVRHLPGETLSGVGHLSGSVVRRLGELAGLTSRALEDYENPGLDRVLQWDLQHGMRTVDLLAEHVPDPELRERLQTQAHTASEQIEAVSGALRRQAGHLDLTDENVIATRRGGVLHPDAVIDFGDLSSSWRVAEIAVTVASILHHPGAEPYSVLPALIAFHELRHLDEAEVEALWPLVALRGAVLAASSEQQVAIDGEHTHASVGLDREWRIFDQANSVPAAVMTGLIRDALDMRPSPRLRLPDSLGRLVPSVTADRVVELDLSPDSDKVDAGIWEAAGAKDALARARLTGGDADAVFTSFGVPQLTASETLRPSSPATIATCLEVWVAERAELVAPWPGSVVGSDGASLTLNTDELVLRVSADAAWLDGSPKVGARDRGEHLVEVPEATRVQVQISNSETVIPPLVRAQYAAGWLSLAADPAPLLGIAPRSPAVDSPLLTRRERSFARVQGHYYDDPPEIERGWRHHLIDVHGRTYLDMVNNVTVLGHAHPHIERAVSRQLRRLNTNSRFNYAAVAEFSERLAAKLPEPLDTVFLVNSGSEATDLALRLAFAATGRRDVVSMLEAYHGWTYLSDAVSTSLTDNPNALGTRPDWVHPVDAPNTYRGLHRAADAHLYGSEAAARIDQLAAKGTPPAAFIAETFFGNAGGIALPDGYLGQVYAAVRHHGGLAIADEVQVGYGRLGEWFWGFEQQQVIPDIVAVAKAIGNGHPLGAVITRREVAEAFRNQGYFFSSTGGSPVSCVIGTTVLDVIEEDGLQDNAREVGAHLRARLTELAKRHQLIGAVHGSGLYMGVELVRDRGTLEPAAGETFAICERMLELGVIVQPTGERDCVLKIKPPLCIDLAAADFFVDQLDAVLTDGW